MDGQADADQGATTSGIEKGGEGENPDQSEKTEPDSIGNATELEMERAEAHRAAEERRLLDQAFDDETVEANLERYLKLSSLYNKIRAEESRTGRLRLAEILCNIGVPLPSIDTFVGTWNVGNAPPNPAELEYLIPSKSRLYDLVVLGLQECEYPLTPEMNDKAMKRVFERRQEVRDRRMIFNNRKNWFTQNSYRNSSRSPLGTRDDEIAEEIGLQETQKAFSLSRFLHRRAMKAEHSAKKAVTSRAGAYFASLVADHLGPDYCVLRECEFMQMRIFIYVRREHLPRISHVEVASQATGIGGVVGNKGGVAISFNFQDTRFCFVSCHLAAHRKYVAERNRDCSEILGMVQRKLATKAASYLSDWDCVFFLGDLNYRLQLNKEADGPDDPLNATREGDSEAIFSRDDSHLQPPAHIASKHSAADLDASTSLARTLSDPREGVVQGAPTKADHTPEERASVMQLIEDEKWSELFLRDQLRQQQGLGLALMGFHEALFYPFQPTFKVARQVPVDYNSKRLPAYCDRILWHITPGLLSTQADFVKQIMLASPIEVSTSDHKPVISNFLITLKQAKKELTSGKLPVYRNLLTIPSGTWRAKGIQIYISKLKAWDLLGMDLGGSADPYVVAYSTELFTPNDKGYQPLQGASRTKVCFKSLQPEWKEALLIRCPSAFARPSDLLGKHLSLSLWDFDTLSQDDHMGEVVVCLDDAVRAVTDRKAHFSERFEEPAKPAEDVSFDQGGSSRAHLFEQKLATGDIAEHGENQFAFIFPVIRRGKKAGMLSGCITLFRPDQRVRIAQLQGIDWTWKCMAYIEQFEPRFVQSPKSEKQGPN